MRLTYGTHADIPYLRCRRECVSSVRRSQKGISLSSGQFCKFCKNVKPRISFDFSRLLIWAFVNWIRFCFCFCILIYKVGEGERNPENFSFYFLIFALISVSLTNTSPSSMYMSSTDLRFRGRNGRLGNNTTVDLSKNSCLPFTAAKRSTNYDRWHIWNDICNWWESLKCVGHLLIGRTLAVSGWSSQRSSS